MSCPVWSRWLQLVFVRKKNFLLLCHIIDNIHELFAKFVGFVHGVSLAVYTDDRLCVALAKVYPRVREVDLYSVDIVDCSCRVRSKHLLNLYKDSVNIGRCSEIDAIFCYRILRERSSELANLATLVGKT